MTRVVRIDADVKAALDRVRDTYGDRNYSAAIRRVLRWKRMVASGSPTDDLPGLRRWL